jgi:hypothetical protein
MWLLRLPLEQLAQPLWLVQLLSLSFNVTVFVDFAVANVLTLEW